MVENEFLDQKITLNRIAIYLLSVPQRDVFVSGIGERKAKDTLIVKWIDTEERIGYGECSCRPDPYYSAEYLAGSMILIQRFIFPFLKKTQTFRELRNILKHIRGWNFTKAAVEAAAFQIIRQQNDFNFSQVLENEPIAKVPAGISLGIFKDKEEFYDEVQKAVGLGYQRLKFKISPNVNTQNFDHINALLFDQNVHVGFDANGSFYHSDLNKLDYFVSTYQTVIEQPFPPNRFDIYQAAKQQYPNLKICFDEEVKGIGDLIKLKELNAIAELNLKIGRVGGVVNSIAILNYCYQNDISCWIGGMFETGIGRLLNLEFASFLPNARAHDLSPSARYFKEDIIHPEVTMNKGFIDVKAMQACKVEEEMIQKFTKEEINLDLRVSV